MSPPPGGYLQRILLCTVLQTHPYPPCMNAIAPFANVGVSRTAHHGVRLLASCFLPSLLLHADVQVHTRACMAMALKPR